MTDPIATSNVLSAPIVASSPTVSVLMAVYNGASIAKAVTSILDQTVTDAEIILVDDGSTDPVTRQELLQLEALEDPRLRVLRQPVNRGLAACLNWGWRESRGAFLARMDADDFSLPDRLAYQLRGFGEEPSLDILGTAIIARRGSNDRTKVLTRPCDHETLVRRIYRENPFFHPTVMMRREVMDRLGGYDESLRRSQDRDLWFRAYHEFRFGNLMTPLVEYTCRSISIPAVRGATRSLLNAGKRDGKRARAAYYAARFCLINGVRSFKNL